jgi:hypothetical protein
MIDVPVSKKAVLKTIAKPSAAPTKPAPPASAPVSSTKTEGGLVVLFDLFSF